jgi:flagellar hook-associated protein 2
MSTISSTGQLGTISSSGVGSGLDVAGLVSKLVQAEGAPKTAELATKEADAQGKLSALGTLRAALADFQSKVAALKDIGQFQGRQTSLSSTDFLAASANTTAAPGSYSIEVQQLASAQKLQSGTFASSSTVVGTGTLHIVAGGQAYDISVDSSNDTLSGIAQAINQSAAGTKLVATVINGAGDSRLVITARDSGVANSFTVSQSGGDGGLATLVYPPSGGGLTQLTAAADSRVLIDGVTATSSTNTIADAIAGVTLTLQDTNATGETTTLTVDYNRSGASQAVSNFVTSYNALVGSISKLASYDTSTHTGGPLFGDAGVQNIVDQLRRVLGSQVPGVDASASLLAQIGVTAQLDGTLKVDSTKLNAAFGSNFDAVGKLFATDKVGIAVKLDSLLGSYLDANGVFDSRTSSLNATIKDIGQQRDALNARLAELQTRYTTQFNALDTLLAQLQSTSSFLTQQLARLPGFTYPSTTTG